MARVPASEQVDSPEKPRDMATSAPGAQQPLPAQAPAPVPVAAAPAARATASRRPLVIGGVALVLAAAGITYWAHSRRFEDTDDAQIDGSISNVGSRVSGTVTGVFVAENQPVKEGDLLAEVDPTDLQIAVDQARAQVAQAQALLDAEDPSVPIAQTTNTSAVSSAQSDVAAAQAALAAAKSDVAQFTAQLAQARPTIVRRSSRRPAREKLVGEGAVSQSDYDQRVNAAAATSAAVAGHRRVARGGEGRVAQQQAQIAALGSHLTEVTANAPRQVATRKASVIMRQAALDLAKAQLAEAEKNLSYARLVAPVSGHRRQEGRRGGRPRRARAAPRGHLPDSTGSASRPTTARRSSSSSTRVSSRACTSTPSTPI